ncbi:hypothetical protein MTIM_53140 [Mycobacterium timonense]|uniref:Uncharacterized protein n=1 Tax=Mycobacterium timonense TaxID=701043 RepID=A0A7I9ZEZ8_9MYCO|nr:hypothetical protein MTIM_53140 [Mycobacterium timonense]
MAFAYSDMLETIKNKQWALADIDWGAPGAELITDEQRPKLKQFMSDVVWIEHVGARAFAAMARRRPSKRSETFTVTFTPRSSVTPTPNLL